MFKTYRPLQFTLWAALSFLLVSCVTINIYFPEAAAEEAARTIVRDVLGKDGQALEKKSSEPQSQQLNDWPLRIAGRLLEAMIPSAQAASPNIDISSPAINRLRGQMKSRQRALSAHYRSGALGFTRDGFVAIRDAGAISLRERNQVKKLVADENRDRQALYREIARANGHPEWEADVRATFARVWASEAPSGTWFEGARGWQQR